MADELLMSVSVSISTECVNPHIMRWKLCSRSYSDGGWQIEADTPAPAKNTSSKGFFYGPFINNLFGMLLVLSHLRPMAQVVV